MKKTDGKHMFLKGYNKGFMDASRLSGMSVTAGKPRDLTSCAPVASHEVYSSSLLLGFPEKDVSQKPTREILEKKITDFIMEKYTTSVDGRTNASEIYQLFAERIQPMKITKTMFGRILGRHFNSKKSNGQVFYQGLILQSEELPDQAPRSTPAKGTPAALNRSPGIKT